MTEYEIEPIRGLPGNLPKGEHILWQGAPTWRGLAIAPFHLRAVAGYFAVLAASGLIAGSQLGAAITAGLGAIGVAVLAALAWLCARTTVYTITNRRAVFRFGMALTKCVNIPFATVAGAAIKLRADGNGDIPLALTADARVGFVHLWPHARPWKVGRPEPMLRGIDDAGVISFGILAAPA